MILCPVMISINKFPILYQSVRNKMNNLTYYPAKTHLPPYLPSLISLCCATMGIKGAQWLSGRVLDSRPKGRGFEPHRRHCVVVLEKDTFILA